MSVSEFHLYLLLIHDFHNKHNFSQKPTRFSSGSNCCDKLGRKKVAALPGTGVFQFGLSTHAHACVHTHTHTVGVPQREATQAPSLLTRLQTKTA